MLEPSFPFRTSMTIATGLLVVPLAMILLGSCAGNDEQMIHRKMLQKLVLDGSADVRFVGMDGRESMGICYRIGKAFPADGLLSHFDGILTANGFVPFTEPQSLFGLREWGYVEEVLAGRKVRTHTLSAEWIDESRRWKLILALMYISPRNTEKSRPVNSDLSVAFQLRPFDILPPPQKVRLGESGQTDWSGTQ